MNSIQAENGTEVYTDDIYMYADEYEESLRDSSKLYEQSSSTFTGLIKYINRKMGFDYNKSMNEDIELLDSIWNTYVDLVYKYNQKPTIMEFALLIGVNRDTIYSWSNGDTRTEYNSKLSRTRSDTVKRWQAECKLGRYKGAAAGNVGYIFLCKAVDGMAETAPVQTEPKRQALPADQLPRLGNVNGSELCEIDTQLDMANDES